MIIFVIMVLTQKYLLDRNAIEQLMVIFLCPHKTLELISGQLGSSLYCGVIWLIETFFFVLFVSLSAGNILYISEF